MTTDTTSTAGYDAEDITVLEGLEAVRKRPGMYIGSTGRGACTTWCTRWSTTASTRRWPATAPRRRHAARRRLGTVADDGRGIPVAGMADQEGKSALEVVLTVLHAGGKFGGDGYKVSGGLHGVGVSVVNALSESLIAEVRRDGHVWRQRYVRRRRPRRDREGERPTDTGTIISFRPDRTSSKTRSSTYDTLAQAVRGHGVPDPGARRVLIDERGEGREQSFHAEGGIIDFVRHLNKDRDPIHNDVAYFEARVRRPRSRSRCSGPGFTEAVHSYANNINTHEGGTHLSGLPHRPDRHDQRLRPGEGSSSRRRTTTWRARTRARGSRRSSPSSSASRSSRGRPRPSSATPRSRDSSVGSSTSGSRSTSRSTPPRHGRSARRASTPPRPDWRPARPATLPAARVCSTPACPASSTTARTATPTTPRSSWSRVTPPAARPCGPRQSSFQAILPLRGKIINVEKARIRQGPGQHRDPGDHRRDGHRHRRGVRPRQGPVPQARR